MPEPLSGVVLAGGASRRLGVDKALLRFGGETLLDLAVRRLSSVCEEVLIAAGTRSPETLPAGVRSVPDAVPGRGPLAGVAAGLRAVSFDFALVVACDMPFLNPDLLLAMKERPRTYQALVPECGGRRHPAHAIYSRRSLPRAESLLEREEAGMHDLLSLLEAETVSEEEVRRHDPDLLSCFNINSQADLEEARRLWERRASG